MAAAISENSGILDEGTMIMAIIGAEIAGMFILRLLFTKKSKFEITDKGYVYTNEKKIELFIPAFNLFTVKNEGKLVIMKDMEAKNNVFFAGKKAFEIVSLVNATRSAVERKAATNTAAAEVKTDTAMSKDLAHAKHLLTNGLIDDEEYKIMKSKLIDDMDKMTYARR